MTEELLITFGWMSIMLLLGSLIRYKIPFFQKRLVPSSIIAGLLGFILINVGIIQVSPEVLQSFVFYLFIISFISIGLTRSNIGSKSRLIKSKATKNTFLKGVFWLILVYAILVNLQAIIGAGTIRTLNIFGNTIDPIYGLLLPFGFAMGSGQAVTYGTIVEGFGYENAAQVALVFASVGYIFAAFAGVAIAKMGIRKGLAKNVGTISNDFYKGVYSKESHKSAGSVAFHASNIETITFHMAIIGFVYVIPYYFAHWLGSFFSPNINALLTGTLFLFGILFALLFRWVMEKVNLEQLFSDDIQKSITGWSVDYMIVASFMVINLSILSEYLLPIILICIIAGILTFAVSFYFGQRIGSESDFEKSLALFGMGVGTATNAILLLRMVDPDSRSPVVLQVGIMNAFGLVLLMQYMIAIAPALWDWSLAQTTLSMAGFAIFYLILLKVLRIWGPKTYTLFGREPIPIESTENNDVVLRKKDA